MSRGGPSESPPGSLLHRVLGAIRAVEPARPGGPLAALVSSAKDPADRAKELARRVAAARHPRASRPGQPFVLICAADHGLALADRRSPDDVGSSASALRAIADGRAAVDALARSAGAALVLVDCGVALAPALSEQPAPLPAHIIDLRIGDGTADIRHGPAMTDAQARSCVDSGIALGLSLAEEGADCIALGHVARGADAAIEIASAVLVGLPTRLLRPPLEELAGAVCAVHARACDDAREPLTLLARLGGYAVGVMAGVILAAASERIPVVLDDPGTALAALLSARLCPAVTGYLFAAHAGHSPGHQQVLYQLGLAPIFEQGVARGEGAGAALAVPILASATHTVAS